MRAFSAADSVSLAVQRTRAFLFRPFSWGTYLKLGLVAILTEGVGTNFHSGSHGGPSSGHTPSGFSPTSLTPGMIAVIVAALLLAFVVSAFLFYLLTRLRFAFFHCLIHSTKELRPGWEIYRTPATRYFWLNVVVGICFLVVVALIAIPFVAGFWRLIRDTPQGGHPDFALLFALLLPLIPIIFLLALAGMVTDLVLRDWMLPHFALDNATAGEAWSSVWTSIKAEKRQFAVYSLLRVILPVIAMVGLFMVLLIPGLILAGSIGALIYGIHSAFASATGASAVVGTLVQVFFGVLAFGFMVLASIALGGPVSTGIREYALIFYGGRYPVLGDILFPPPPAQAAPAVGD